MSENAITKLSDLGIELAPKKDSETFLAVAKTKGFLPRIQLQTSNSKACKKGSFPVNRFALVEGQELIDIGAKIDVLLISWRPCAIGPVDGKTVGIYHIDHPLFKQIQRAADADGNSGNLYGPQFLVYLPSKDLFATFLFASPSARNEAPKAEKLLGQAATFGSQLLSNNKYEWYSVSVTACSAITVPDPDNFRSRLTEIQGDFDNPPPGPEIATEEEQKSTDRER